jgi:hypothetical protein
VNVESHAKIRLGSDFHSHNGMPFSKVVALHSTSELMAYTAGKDFVSPSIGIWTTVTMAPTPARKMAPSPPNTLGGPGVRGIVIRSGWRSDPCVEAGLSASDIVQVMRPGAADPAVPVRCPRRVDSGHTVDLS